MLDALAIRGQLGRILTSPAFSHSPRMSRFLTFVVEETLAGRSEHIKEYAIAIEVFEKRHDYDPRVDSTVRTEASKLRSRLAEYYSTQRPDDTIVITIPKGMYLPSFIACQTSVLPGRSRGAWLIGGGALLVAAVVLAAALLRTSAAGRGHSGLPFEQIRITPVTQTGDIDEAVISPDGEYIAYFEGVNGHQSLRVRHTNGITGEIELIPRSGVVVMGLTWSPDGVYVYYVLEEGPNLENSLYRIAMLAGRSERIMQGIHSPVSFSPDGLRFAFIREDPVRGTSALMIADSDGGNEKTVASRILPDFLDYPAWSPDGETVVCTTARQFAESAGLIAVDPASGDETSLAAGGWRTIRQPKWLANGRGLVALARREEPPPYQLWYIGFPSGRVHRLTGDSDQYTGVSVARNPGRLLAVRTREVSSLWVSPADDVSGGKQIDSGAQRRFQTAWTPDGRLVYHRATSDGASIWIAASDGTGRKQLTTQGLSLSPAVCEGGRTMVYSHKPPGGAEQLRRIDLDGTNPMALANVDGAIAPQCSPAGGWVVYSTGPWQRLTKVSLSGGGPAELDTGRSRYPVLSPNGEWIATFHTPASAGFQNVSWSIALFPIEGGPPKKTISPPRTVEWAAGLRWTPDGNAIAYVDNKGGESNIWAQPLDGGRARVLTDFRGLRIRHFNWSNDGKLLSYERSARTSEMVLIEEVRE